MIVTDQTPDVIVVRSLLTEYGGAEHAAALTAVGLKRRGHRVTAVTRPPVRVTHPYYQMLAREPVPVVVPRAWHEQPALQRVARAARPALWCPTARFDANRWGRPGGACA